MKERPILFSAQMVRGLLSGTKTQTRRAAKLTCNGHVKESGGHRRWHPADPNAVLACPYGQPGDRLWVRETWNTSANVLPPISDPYIYGADLGPTGVSRWAARWKPSIHMPRAASRISLEVTGVRVERLQDISEADAMAEGIFPHVRGGWHWLKHDTSNLDDWNQFGYRRPAQAYQALWESINGPESWSANPWVWCVEFKRLEAA